MTMSPEIDESTARQLLAEAKERAEAALADIEKDKRADHEGAAEEIEPQDRGERIEESEVDEALERRLRNELDAIERAERRLEEGTYGLSVVSGDPIPAERLKAIPWADRTIEEQR